MSILLDFASSGATFEGADTFAEGEDGGGMESSRSRFAGAGDRVRVDLLSPLRLGERERRGGRSDLEDTLSVAC